MMLVEIESFVNWHRRRNPHARTWRDYRYDLKQFAAVVGDRPPGSITFHDVDQFVTAQAESGYQPATINRRLAAIASLYTFLSDDDPDLACPVLPHRHALKQPLRLPRPVPEGDLRKFFGVIADPRDKAIFTLMLRCRLRISEVANLQLADLYLDRRRRVPCDFVFLSYQDDGMSTTAIHKRLMRYRDQAGVSLTAHRLRHTFANDLVNADVPVVSIQKLLGHAWLETTQTYITANDRKVQADFEAATRKLEEWQ